MAAVLSFPPVTTLLSFGLKAIARTPPRCVDGEKLRRLLKFQMVTRPVCEPSTSQFPVRLKPMTLGTSPVQSGELTLPVAGLNTGISPSS